MSATNPVSLKSKLLILVVVFVAALIPFQFWRGVWFGQDLTDEELESALQEGSSARRVQHALAQLDQRIREADPSVERWIPEIAGLAGHPRLEVRVQAAWVMGQKNDALLFQETLAQMLQDPEPLVQRNAALGLTRFGDRRALPILRSMLEPFPIPVPLEGAVTILVREGERVTRNTELARLKSEPPRIIQSPLPGRVSKIVLSNDEAVTSGQILLTLSPDPEHVWEALRALYLLGGEEELPLVEAMSESPAYNDRLREQAQLTAQAIRRRLPEVERKPK